MKKITILTALAGMMAVSSLHANQVTTVDGYGPYQTGQGGEFTLLLSAPDSATTLGYYTAAAKNVYQAGTFQTFCVEGTEYIYPNTTATTTITPAQMTVFGGKNLTAGAAFLYYEFATGGFTGAAAYNYGSGRSTSATLLQNAIWYYMGQESQTYSGSNPYEVLANSTFASLSLGAFTVNSSLATQISVDVLHLWSSDASVGTLAGAMQDQLILTGNQGYNRVPDGGMTVALLGMALTGLAAVNRKIGK